MSNERERELEQQLTIARQTIRRLQNEVQAMRRAYDQLRKRMPAWKGEAR